MIHYCLKCKAYTLLDNCSTCKGKTTIKKPAKFSILKDYSKQRLESKGYL
ncbi:MAG: nucleolar RNA-binding Nop10p family protein [Candidatus Nanoarchaeia archaeon]|nr:nucleolar RNA-binding Nop10p family protein [Candidatus Nanoarchaeia archaeon]